MANETYHPRGQLVDGYAVRDHPSYMVWADMKSRCRDEDNPGFVNYGGRGITYCDRWKHFANFAADLGVPPFPGASIDRIDNDGMYEPGNVKWSTRSEQMRNRRTFKNNTSGAKGVDLNRGRFVCRYQTETERFNLGRFASVEDAAAYREKFIALLAIDRQAALKMTERRARSDSSTGVKGVTRREQKDGAVRYIARRTVRGVREYVGHFHSIEAAVAALGKAA